MQIPLDAFLLLFDCDVLINNDLSLLPELIPSFHVAFGLDSLSHFHVFLVDFEHLFFIFILKCLNRLIGYKFNSLVLSINFGNFNFILDQVIYLMEAHTRDKFKFLFRQTKLFHRILRKLGHFTFIWHFLDLRQSAVHFRDKSWSFVWRFWWFVTLS